MRHLAAIAGVGLLLTGAFALGLEVTRAHESGRKTLSGTPRDTRPAVSDEVRRELVSAYYRSVPSAILAKEDVDEMIEGLGDPYTDYLTAQEYADLQNRTAKSYGGIGLTVGQRREGLIVKAALAGPARAAGIKPGDLIVSIDGRRIQRVPFDRSLELIKGEKGTRVALTVRRPREGTIQFTVERTDIELPAVRSRLIRRQGAAPLGYVHILSFRANTVDSVEQRTSRLVKRGAKGVVLDLRDNPGGLLQQAIGTVSLFVKRGVVCVTDGIHHGRTVYSVTGKAPLADVPLIVLVDEQSASAAEVVAGALGDDGRALVVGRQTYGKASVQSLRELSNGAALKLTTAVFRTPSGVNLMGKGLRPDVHAYNRPETVRDEALLRAQGILRTQLTH
jgi:carboxyl-terminal processing protease